MKAGLVLDRVTVRYGEVVAVSDVSLTIPQGAITALVGPNGSGKSSLVRAMVGATPHEGRITVPSADGGHGPGRIAWVPQRSAVDWDFPLRVCDVVMQGRTASHGLFGRPGAADIEAVTQALRVTGLTELAERPIGRLSGGQQQRTFVARALAQGAPVVLLDEPFAGLDVTNERALLGALRTAADAGRTVVLVHHDLALVAAACDHAVLLRSRVISAGPPAESLTPAHIAAAFGVGAAAPATSMP